MVLVLCTDESAGVPQIVNHLKTKRIHCPVANFRDLSTK